MKKQFYSYFDNELSQKEKEKNKSVNRIYSVNDSFAENYEDSNSYKTPNIYDNYLNNTYKKDYRTNSYFPSNIYSTPTININQNSTSVNNIDKWEKKHDKWNNMKRGAIYIIKQYATTKPIAEAYENFMDKKEIREAIFPFKSLKHVKAAYEIGLGIQDKGKNLSSNTERFAKKYDEFFNGKENSFNDFYYIREGRNAIRHTIWQAAITSKYGPQVARDAGDAHETRPYFDVNVRVFDKESDADMTVDLLNNKIGRRLGVEIKNRNTKEIALRVLEEYWKNGLYSYERGNDGRWYILKKKLSDNVFYSLYRRFLHLNEYGE